ncbi:MAG: hypothetical protein H7A21_17470 [Spirochaetales bacterium]|nr:hypothetical protein [Leptospiraceae bacterium]MCP5483232.1 hypothetical protein [Spirochaetales bacterium]
MEDFLESARGRGQFELRLAGETAPAPCSREACLYHESALFFGQGSYQVIEHSQRDLLLATTNGLSAGPLALPLRRVRTYLEPCFERWLRLKSPDLTAEFRRLLEGAGAEEACLVEYALFPERMYFARVESERYHLPPRPGEAPRQRINLVLGISDRPFVAEPQRTPHYRGWAY